MEKNIADILSFQFEQPHHSNSKFILEEDVNLKDRKLCNSLSFPNLSTSCVISMHFIDQLFTWSSADNSCQYRDYVFLQPLKNKQNKTKIGYSHTFKDKNVKDTQQNTFTFHHIVPKWSQKLFDVMQHKATRINVPSSSSVLLQLDCFWYLSGAE